MTLNFDDLILYHRYIEETSLSLSFNFYFKKTNLEDRLTKLMELRIFSNSVV